MVWARDALSPKFNVPCPRPLPDALCIIWRECLNLRHNHTPWECIGTKRHGFGGPEMILCHVLGFCCGGFMDSDASLFLKVFLFWGGDKLER